MVSISLANFLALIQAVISAGVGVATIIVYFRITKIANSNNDELNALTNKNNLNIKINSDLDRIVDFTIQYPYFDDPVYKNQYQNDLESKEPQKRERAYRYNAFAIMNYNFVEDLFTFYDGNEEEMGNYCDFKELIKDHKSYWINLDEREKKGYHKIRPLIETVIAEIEKAD